MRQLRPWALAAAAVLGGGSALWGQGELSTGAANTANPLQTLGQGARPLAMGSAFTAVRGDLMAAHFNPAGQAYLRGAQAAFNHHNWLGGINQDSLAAVIAGPALSVGLYGDLVNYGSIDSYGADGQALGSFTPMDFTLGMALAHQWGNGLALGATVRGTQQNLKDSGQLLNSGDLGLMWATPGRPLTLGLAYTNIGPSVNGHATTSALRLGFSYDAEITQRSGVLVAAGLSGQNNGASALQLGLEGRLGRNFFLRGGYQFSFMDNQTGGLSGLSSGLGAKVGPLVLDYAYLPYGRIGNSHRLSLNVQFDDGRNDAPAVKIQPDTPMPLKRLKPLPEQAPAPAVAPVPAPAQVPVPAVTGDGGKAVDMVFEVPSTQEEQLLQATKDRPEDAKAWKDLGRYYYGKKDKARMVEAYAKAVALDPADAALKAWLDKVQR